LSTYPAVSGCSAPCYAWSAGTSMAAPHVSGVAALVGSASATLLADPIRLRARLLSTGRPLAATAGKTATGRLLNALRAIDLTKPVVSAADRFGVKIGTVIGDTSVKINARWPAATDTGSGLASYELRRHGPTGWFTVPTSGTTAEGSSTLQYGSDYRYDLRAFDRAGNAGGPVSSATVRATLHQSGTSMATYGSGWSSVKSSTASTGYQNTSSTAGSTMTFAFTGRSVAIIAPKGPTRGSMKVYVDGTYISTVSLYRSSYLAKSAVFSRTFPSQGAHQVKVVVVGTSGHPRVDIDAFVVVR
ncbi:MAG TPA: S8 family serine peptidase, partial [Candidatus Saccharimonadales bacterium]|nr:S8 family serine peptidase [Candidatus Saccharimonadales bacterium]